MEKIKTILDRKPLSSDYIRSKQDFANVVKGAKGLGKPYWQTNWFYGTVGVAAVAILVTAVTLSSSEDSIKNPDQKQVMTALNKNSEPKEPSVSAKNPAQEKETPIAENDPSEEVPAPENNQRTQPNEETQNTVSRESEEVDTSEARTRELPNEEEESKEVEIGMPNVAGVTGGPIAFKDFCDPLGIQVDGGVIIHQYTIQYRSCARDITMRIRGNQVPQVVCNEISDCGSPIEVTFSNFKATNKDNNAVKLKAFSLVTVP